MDKQTKNSITIKAHSVCCGKWKQITIVFTLLEKQERLQSPLRCLKHVEIDRNICDSLDAEKDLLFIFWLPHWPKQITNLLSLPLLSLDIIAISQLRNLNQRTHIQQTILNSDSFAKNQRRGDPSLIHSCIQMSPTCT